MCVNIKLATYYEIEHIYGFLSLQWSERSFDMTLYSGTWLTRIFIMKAHMFVYASGGSQKIATWKHENKMQNRKTKFK